MTGDMFGVWFDLQDERLRQLGNPLRELDQAVDGESFRSLLDRVHEKERKSRAGARPKEGVMLCKGLVIQHLYGLRDDPLACQIEDRAVVGRCWVLATLSGLRLPGAGNRRK